MNYKLFNSQTIQQCSAFPRGRLRSLPYLVLLPHLITSIVRNLYSGHQLHDNICVL